MAVDPNKNRCPWCGDAPDYQQYHDEVWGIPVYDSQDLFAKLCLDGQQAGLSWITILRKQKGYEDAFFNFDPYALSKIKGANRDACIEAQMQNPEIIRNRLKIESIFRNADAYVGLEQKLSSKADSLQGPINTDGAPERSDALTIANEGIYGSSKENTEPQNFSEWLWAFVGGAPIVNTPQSMADIPTQTKVSQQMSKQLKRAGFNFVGPTICYAFMQAVGMVNDHLNSCDFKHIPGRRDRTTASSNRDIE